MTSMMSPAGLTVATEPACASAAPARAPMVQIRFLTALLEQDGQRFWHVLATNDGRWFHSVERFPESARSAALDYLSQLRPEQRNPALGLMPETA